MPRLTTLTNTVSVIFSVQPERISYVLVLGADTSGDCRTYIKSINEIFTGRGGGKPDCAQGGAPYCEDWANKLEQTKEALLKI